MNNQDAIKIFEDKKVRTVWDEEQEKWFFSVIDVIEVLTNNSRARKYWSDLKIKLKKEGSELSEKIGQLKITSTDGKSYKTDVADTEQLFRLIQAIPSPKAEPFKVWLAKVEGMQFATLTDIITQAWADKTTKEYKTLKGLKKENLRDNMTNTELILNMLAEASTKDISQAVNPASFEESKKVAKQGGNVAKVAMKELEAKTGKKVVTALNAKSFLQLKKGKDD